MVLHTVGINWLINICSCMHICGLVALQYLLLTLLSNACLLSNMHDKLLVQICIVSSHVFQHHNRLMATLSHES